LSDLDAQLARQISAAARTLEVEADPTAVQSVQLTIDALVTADVRPVWRAVLGHREVGDEDLLDPRGRGPSIWFQPMDGPRPQRNRVHVDVFVPNDEAEARVAAALAAGGRLVDDTHAPHSWTLADAEGNEVDVRPRSAGTDAPRATARRSARPVRVAPRGGARELCGVKGRRAPSLL
jgi:4a-hydroxytetrahydrobiopterin dehydratase